MPRRNRNARPVPDEDQLTAALGQAATLTIADGKYPCAGCRKRGHWNGRYCTLCLGALVLSARRTVLAR
jgi:hypothetical protein